MHILTTHMSWRSQGQIAIVAFSTLRFENSCWQPGQASKEGGDILFPPCDWVRHRSRYLETALLFHVGVIGPQYASPHFLYSDSMRCRWGRSQDQHTALVIFLNIQPRELSVASIRKRKRSDPEPRLPPFPVESNQSSFNDQELYHR
jgi:hypothetical protein